MIKAFFKRGKIKVELEKAVDSWDIRYSSPESIIGAVDQELKSAIVHRIMLGIECDLTEKIKEQLVEQLANDESIQQGVKEHVKENIREMLRRGY